MLSLKELQSSQLVYITAILFFFYPSILMAQTVDARSGERPLKIGIVGLVHGHVHGFLRDALAREDIEVVGVVEEDASLLKAYGDRYNVPVEIRYSSLGEMLRAASPEAITVFTNTFDHKAVVEESAAEGVHVMMEKPLAVNMAHARAIQKAARDNGIHVLVNYETTWYPSNEAVYQLQDAGKLGTLRKIVVHDGHFGPKEIGVSEEFLAWLTDPKLNGGGALTDFGCYGANLMTWLMKGEMPVAVTAVTQQLKTDPVYASVDDETTILVEYKTGQGIIQASWNWPYHRKDMEVYGDDGYVIAPNKSIVRYSKKDSTPEPDKKAEPLNDMKADPLSYLKGVVRGEIKMAPHDLSALENNMMVTRILDAARESAATGKRVQF